MEPLGDAREALGETMKTPGDAGETIVTPGDAEEHPTTATRSSMKGSSLGHSSGTKNTCMERRSDVLAKNCYLKSGQLVGPALPKEE